MLPTPPEGLRHWRPADTPALEAAWADPSIAAWNPARAGADAAGWIAGIEERWERRLALDLVIIPPDERADRRVGVRGRHQRADPCAGEVGLSSFTADPARAELGVWVAAEQRRTGLATVAVDTTTRWALTDLGLDQLWARTDPANRPAVALFERLGWQRLGESGGKAIWSATPMLLR